MGTQDLVTETVFAMDHSGRRIMVPYALDEPQPLEEDGDEVRESACSGQFQVK